MALVPWVYNNPRRKLGVQQEDINLIFSGHQIQLKQRCDKHISLQENTAYKLWDGAYLLARHLENLDCYPHEYWNNKTCIELGAGFGLVSLSSWLLGSTVIVTDHPSVIDHCKSCIRHNVEKIVNCEKNLDSNRIHVIPYSWGSPTSEIFNYDYDFVFGSDIIYNTKDIPNLILTLDKLMSKNTIFLLSIKFRGLEEHLFFKKLKICYSWYKLPTEKHPKDYLNSSYEIYVIRLSENL